MGFIVATGRRSFFGCRGR